MSLADSFAKSHGITERREHRLPSAIARSLDATHEEAKKVLDQDIADGVLDDVPSEFVSNRALQNQTVWAEDVLAAVARLPRQSAAVLRLAALDLTYEEMADRLRVGIGTVKSRLWRAREALKRELTGERA